MGKALHREEENKVEEMHRKADKWGNLRDSVMIERQFKKLKIIIKIIKTHELFLDRILSWASSMDTFAWSSACLEINILT